MAPRAAATGSTEVSLPINDDLWMRLATLFLYKLNSISWVRRWRRSPQGIVFLSSRLCIKVTGFTRLAEASTLRYIAEHAPTVKVPRVYCSFEHKGHVYILMERVTGRELADGWRQRTDASRARILAQLREMVDALRALQPPGDRIGVAVANVDGGPIFDQRFPRKHTWGPFPTIRDFHRELHSPVELDQLQDEDSLTGMRDLLVFHEEERWMTAPSVLTHGDLSSLNIMADGDTVTSIIDWETAGWMPPYWEYASAWHVNPYNTFWQVGRFLKPWPHELEMEKIRQRWFYFI